MHRDPPSSHRTNRARRPARPSTGSATASVSGGGGTGIFSSSAPPTSGAAARHPIEEREGPALVSSTGGWVVSSTSPTGLIDQVSACRPAGPGSSTAPHRSRPRRNCFPLSVNNFHPPLAPGADTTPAVSADVKLVVIRREHQLDPGHGGGTLGAAAEPGELFVQRVYVIGSPYGRRPAAGAASQRVRPRPGSRFRASARRL